MTPNDLPRFVQLIAALASNYRQEADEATLEAYRIGLADLPVERIETAVSRAIRECKSLPPAAGLRELAGELLPIHRAVKAWEVFRKAVFAIGPYRSVVFDDPVLTATARNLGGWGQVIEQMETEGEKWVRKDFERVYISLNSSGVARADVQPLPGIHERENKLNGYVDAIQKPVTIRTALPPHRPGVVPALEDDTEPLSIAADLADHLTVPDESRSTAEVSA